VYRAVSGRSEWPVDSTSRLNPVGTARGGQLRPTACIVLWRCAVLYACGGAPSQHADHGKNIIGKGWFCLQVKKDKEDLTKQWGTTGILGTLEGHARGIQACCCCLQRYFPAPFMRERCHMPKCALQLQPDS